ncbi:hypothetical protein ACS0TY_006048 [Phlomoides rotata]
MNRDTFNRFCYLLRHSGGLVDGRYVSVGEQVAIFLSVLSHHSKVRVVKFCFKRSSHTVHQDFHNVLRVVLNLHGSLLASPTPVDDECTHPRWKHFKVLSDAMKRIVSEGWKTENGFKTGYLNLLHTYVKQVLPNTDFKLEPHINSRITMLKHTGVGFDSTTTMVDATDEQWEAFMKKDPNARHMRHKSWPLYAAWCEIFGQSRATGDSAQSHMNA